MTHGPRPLSLGIGFLLSLGCAVAEGTDLTFCVAADVHFGWAFADVNNRVQIAAMNGLRGTAYPPQIGGTVGTPSGVLVAGDLTDGGAADEWTTFVAQYGLNGSDGLLQYPVYEGSGNHDSDTIRQGIRDRHGRLAYSWDWGPVHLVSLDVYPTAAELDWLRHDLAFIGPERPVVLFHHYGFDSFSVDWWTAAEREAYKQAIAGYNVVGIFHGHVHDSWNYKWEGYDVYTPGSVKGPYGFIVVRVTDTAMAVAEYHWTTDGSGRWIGGYWEWSHTKAITIPAGGYCEEPPPGGGPNRRYVAAGATPGGNGLSWPAAYNDLQDALADASNAGLDVGEIWVAGGTYRPDRATGDRAASFRLVRGVSVLGGFGGWEDSADQRDPAVNVTILSGDLNRNDGPGFANNGENSFHVVAACGADATAVLDGFTITAGNANGTAGDGRGGGMFCRSAAPTVMRCAFQGNSGLFGAGMCSYGSQPTVTECRFISNAAGGSVDSEGGGMLNFQSDVSLTDCSFSGNSAVGDGGGIRGLLGGLTLAGCTFDQNAATNGGGMCNSESQVGVTGCTFTGNAAAGSGGAIRNSYGGGTTLSACTFSNNAAASGGGIGNDNAVLAVEACTVEGNSAAGAGGGIYNMQSQATVTNCTFAGNSATNGGGLYTYMIGGTDPHLTAVNCTFGGNVASTSGVGKGGGGLYLYGAASTLTNCIFWGNRDPVGTDVTAQIRRSLNGTLAVGFTCVQDSNPNDGSIYAGTGNIDDNPLFVREPSPGPDGTWNGVDDDFGDLRLGSGSPCIDAGNNAAVTQTWDLAGMVRRADDLAVVDTGSPPGGVPIVDMGAYEHGIPADADGDGDVDGMDFLTFSNCFNGSNRSPLAACANPNLDLDTDADIDGFDFLSFVNCYNGSNRLPLCR